jgi:uroporphyrinogen-III synthase
VRVIVTRPEDSARRTAERLIDLGHQPILIPLTKAIHHPDLARVALNGPHAVLAITSAQAVQTLSALGPDLSRFFDETLFAVGKASAKAAEMAGFRRIRIGPGTGAALAEFIASDAPNLPDPLLYLAGSPRSQKFEDGLRAKGVGFSVAEIYTMQPIDYDEEETHEAWRLMQVDAVMLYSAENTRLFFARVASHMRTLDEVTLLAISESVAASVPPQFHRNIKIAAQPDEDGLFALL